MALIEIYKWLESEGSFKKRKVDGSIWWLKKENCLIDPKIFSSFINPESSESSFAVDLDYYWDKSGRDLRSYPIISVSKDRSTFIY